jgi:hypothetical protein
METLLEGVTLWCAQAHPVAPPMLAAVINSDDTMRQLKTFYGFSLHLKIIEILHLGIILIQSISSSLVSPR